MATDSQWFECIGRATHGAAVIDLYLMNALRVSCGLNLKQAHAIYYTPDALQTRIKLIRNILKQTGAPMILRTIVNDIAVLAERAAKKRNELAHSFMTSDGLHRLNLKHMDQPAVRITAGYMQTAAQAIADAVNEVEKKYASLCSYAGARPQLFW
jgi:hypothetical protein